MACGGLEVFKCMSSTHNPPTFETFVDRTVDTCTCLVLGLLEVTFAALEGSVVVDKPSLHGYLLTTHYMMGYMVSGLTTFLSFSPTEPRSFGIGIEMPDALYTATIPTDNSSKGVPRHVTSFCH